MSNGDSIVRTPIRENDMSISMVLMISSQWCALFHHLRYFYVERYA